MNLSAVLLLSAGGFILFNWWRQQDAATGSGSGSPPPSTGTSAPSGATSPSSSTPASSSPNTSSSTTAPRPISTLIPAAADGDASAIVQVAQSGLRFNVDQWNYWREQHGAIAVLPQDMDIMILPGEDRATLLSITEYRDRLARIGLAGIGRVKPGSRANSWIT